MVSKTTFSVRYAETDRMGVAHHANYLVWYEQARTDFTKQLGTSYGELEEMGFLSPVLSVESQYLLPCTYEDEITIECRLTKATAAQMEFCYTVTKKGENSPINRGKTRHGWVDKETFRPISLKRKAPHLFQKLCDALEKEATEDRGAKDGF